LSGMPDCLMALIYSRFVILVFDLLHILDPHLHTLATCPDCWSFHFKFFCDHLLKKMMLNPSFFMEAHVGHHQKSLTFVFWSGK
jgi:hypothetical protein